MSETSTSPADAVQSAAALAKSVGRLSVAMSVLAARQATSLLRSSSAAGASSGDDVARAAREHLSGPIRTAFAVGTNIQAGIVDAAFDMAGFAKLGPAPTGDTTGLTISMSDRMKRRVNGVQTVASGAPGRPVPQSELVARLVQYHDDSSSGGATRQKAVEGLWKSEGLATTIGKFLLKENLFSDPALPAPVLPIAHVGFGSGSTEALLFDREALGTRFTEVCHPDYIPFAYEGIGAILRLYERGLFKMMSGALGLIPLDAGDGPDGTNFFATYLAQFDEDTQRLITHGYGRLVAFSNIDIYTAIRQATALPAERIAPAVHGCGFAFGMMNSADMPRILQHSDVPFEPSVRAAFQNGLVYSLVFFDWYTPGLLESWQPTAGPLETELIELARREAEGSKRRGQLLPFRLETPRS